MNTLDELLDQAVNHITPNPFRIEELVSQGACVNGKQGDGSLLWHCVAFRKMGACLTLINLGADPNLKFLSQSGKFPWYTHDLPYPLHLAVTTQVETFPLMLMANGANPHLFNKDGLSAEDVACELSNSTTRKAISLPLHSAVGLNWPDECIQLLERGFSPHVKDESGMTPLDHAVANSAEKIEQVLRSWIAREAALSSIALCAKPRSAPW